MQQVSPRSLATSPNGTTRHTVLPNGSGAGSTQASVNKLNHFPSTSVGFKTSRTATQREEGKWGKFLPPPVFVPPLWVLMKRNRAKTTAWRGLIFEAGAVGREAGNVQLEDE